MVEKVEVDGSSLEYAWFGAGAAQAPTLVLLHEGLGCLAMWRDFPVRLAEATGARVLAYSRRGYGGSDAVPLPRPLTYMHDEGLRVLPALLAALDVDDAVLVGHSDGGSIALIHAGGSPPPLRARGLVLMAPHVFCEDVSVSSIREARAAYDERDLRARLLRYHGANVDCAFRGWNDAWLDPGFRAWNLEEYLPRVRLPVLAIQGADDPYGTLAQIDAIERGVEGPFRRLVLAACGHDPARDARDATLVAIRDFIAPRGPLDRPATTAP